jgi:elongation factor G
MVRYGVPSRLMFLNKLDRPGASFRSSLQSILSHRIHPNPLPIVLPVASFDKADYDRAEPGVHGLVDLVKWELWKWDGDQHSRHPLPRNEEQLMATHLFPSDHPILRELIPARIALLENLSMFSEDLMEQLLELSTEPSSYLSVAPSAIIPHLRASTIRNEILPVIGGSAMKNIGTELVLDYAGELFADPLTVSAIPKPESSPLRVLAWKVSWDKRKGWMTFVRVYSGMSLIRLYLYSGLNIGRQTS